MNLWLTCETIPRVCSDASGSWAWTAGSTGRVHFTRAWYIIKCEGQTIRAIETAEEAFSDMVCSKCFVVWNYVIYFKSNGFPQRESETF